MSLKTLPKIRSARAQVEDAISSLIKTMHPGDQLLPEPESSRQLGVSRATLREVLRSFAERGVLVRRQGVGTFVTSRIPILETGLEVLESLERMADRLKLQTEVTYLDIEERLATPGERQGLACEEPLEILAVSRVITIEGEPVADLIDVVPLTFLRAADLESNFKGSVSGYPVGEGKTRFGDLENRDRCCECNRSDSRRLGIAPGTALLKLGRAALQL